MPSAEVSATSGLPSFRKSATTMPPGSRDGYMSFQCSGFLESELSNFDQVPFSLDVLTLPESKPQNKITGSAFRWGQFRVAKSRGPDYRLATGGIMSK
jgi:hypothetical protein